MYERFARAPTESDSNFEAAIDAAFVPVEVPPQTAAENEDTANLVSGISAVTELFHSLTARLHLQELSTDDLLVLGIIFLILRRNAEWDVLLIMAVLFFLGLFDDTTP